MGKKSNPYKVFRGSHKELLAQLQGAILIAIDTEATFRQRTQGILGCQVGISILDIVGFSTNITTHNFACGSASYCARARSRFKFGESRHMEMSGLGDAIRSVYPVDRDVVLIGHNLGAEVQMLKRCDVSLTVKCVVDTEELAMTVLPQLAHNPSLSALGEILQIPMPLRHSAGNDAHYTLITLLGLLTNSMPQGVDVDFWCKLFVFFQETRATVAETKVPGMPQNKFNRISQNKVNCTQQKKVDCMQLMKLKVHPSAYAERAMWRRMMQEHEQAAVQADRAARRELMEGSEWDIAGAGAGIVVEE